MKTLSSRIANLSRRDKTRLAIVAPLLVVIVVTLVLTLSPALRTPRPLDLAGAVMLNGNLALGAFHLGANTLTLDAVQGRSRLTGFLAWRLA